MDRLHDESDTGFLTEADASISCELQIGL